MCINFLPQPLTQTGISQIYIKQNIFIKIPIVFGSDWPIPSRSNTTLNQISFIPGSITRVNTQIIDDSSVYLDCFIILRVSRSITSAHTYMPRLLHSSDCSSVSTFCTDNDLDSRVYIGIYRFSCYLPPTELDGGHRDDHVCLLPITLLNFLRVCRQTNDYGTSQGWWTFGRTLLKACFSWPLIGRSFYAHWDKLMASLPSPYLLVIILRWIRTISFYPVISFCIHNTDRICLELGKWIRYEPT